MESQRQRDPDRAVVTQNDQHQIDILEFWANKAKEMQPRGLRIKSFTKDTSNALNWTCNCFMQLC